MLKKIDRRSFVLALTLGFILTLTVSLCGWYSESVQGGVSEQVMRFHVRANSNSEADQGLKALVKDGVLEHFRQGLEQSGGLEETREFLTRSLTEIEEYAAGVIADNGYDYSVSAVIAHDYFPSKTYGDVRLPAGNYEALRIDIGEAKGDNWWCVMFPPLCFVDVSLKEIPAEEKDELRSILTDDEYALITGDSTDIKLKFKVVEVWQKVKSEGEVYFAKLRSWYELS